ncbi:hypothetical protein A9Q83_09680 [Alphaproteobacteria bacterium 46_93_T64]|nr:hypothetical protein A9Q83_09680 [Alphaproteobacteria bacterium 46_93_T64]
MPEGWNEEKDGLKKSDDGAMPDDGTTDKAKEFEGCSDLEIALATCWKRCLNVDGLLFSASFLDLGGTPALAKSLAMDIEQATGQTLDPETVLQLENFGALSTIISAPEIPLRDLIVTFQEGSQKTALICVHGITYYREISTISSPDTPVYGLLAKEHQALVSTVGEGQDQEVDLDRLIETYYTMIRNLQPKGPYQLIGHSFGGVIAFEIAKRLRNEGEAVDKLFLIDALLKDPFYPYMVQKIVKLFRLIRQGNWGDLGRIMRRVGSKFMRFGRHWQYRVSPSKLSPSSPALAERVTGKYRQVMHGYIPAKGVYDSPVILIRAHKTRTLSANRDDYGWQPLIGPPVEFIDLPGTHLTCVVQPNINNLERYFAKNTSV